jgi:hypothetical protein
VKISLVHPHRVTREVLIRSLAGRLDATVVDFSCIEDLLSSSMDYDVFVLYNIFGREKMDRWEGVKWIRFNKPDALIVAMVHHRFFDRRFAPPGGDAILLRVGDEIEGLIKLIKEGRPGKLFFVVSGLMQERRE